MDIKKVQCIDAFVKDVQQEINIACALPINLPKKEVLRIIKYAEKFFHKNYEDSVEEKFFVIMKEAFATPEFRATGEILLPTEVFSVTGVWEIGRETISSSFKRGSVDSDFSIYKFIYNDQYNSVGIASDSLMYYVVNESFYDLARQILVNKISHTYNRLNNVFRFMGGKPKEDVVLEVYTNIDICDLMKEEIFYRYVVANCKIQLSRILGTFNYQLPGNISINYDLIRDEGREELDKIIEEIKTDDSADYFMTS